MAWTITDRFPSWGESGEFPADGFFYEGGDQVNEKHLDALWNGIKGLENDVQAALNDIDSDSDGTVDNADQLEGNSASAFADSNHGNEEHSTTFLPQSDYTPISDINNDSDHGSTAPHNYFSGDYNDLFNRSHGNEDHDSDFLFVSDYNPEADTHSRPTNTNSSGSTVTSQGFRPPIFDGGTFDTRGTIDELSGDLHAQVLYLRAHRLLLNETSSDTSSTADVNIYYQDGTKEQTTIQSGTSPTWVSTDPSKLITWVAHGGNTGMFVEGIERVDLESHTHSI